jgi:hypothetical protein
MTRASYAGNALILREEAQPRAETRRPVVQAVSEPPTPLRPPGEVLRIVLRGLLARQQPRYHVMFFAHHGRAGGNATLRGPFEKWVTKLRSLRRLREGWDGYNAPAPGQHAINAAESYLATLELLRWEPTRLEASVMGGVGITHRFGTRKVYIEFYNDGRVHALCSDRTASMRTAPVGADVQSFYRFIRTAREHLNV